MTNTVTRLSAIILAGVVAAAAFSLYAFDASAQTQRPGGDHQRGDDGDRTEIEVENEGTTVSNNVTVKANTGGNDANGGDGDDGGNGGDARDGNGGNGGRGGNGAAGGLITTGPADAYGTVYNDVNNNRVVVEGCGCDDDNDMPLYHRFFHFDKDGKVLKIEVENERTAVRNALDVKANTGYNDANGGDGDDGGNGGDAGDRRSHHSWFHWFSNQDNGGNGGAGGNGAAAGTIRTGVATAEGHTTSYVNTNVVRVLRGADAPAPVLN